MFCGSTFTAYVQMITNDNKKSQKVLLPYMVPNGATIL